MQNYIFDVVLFFTFTFCFTILNYAEYAEIGYIRKKINAMGAYIISLTVKVDSSVSDKWKAWAVDFFIPHLTHSSTGKNIVFTRVVSMNDPDGETYSIQVTVDGQPGVSRFEQQGMPEFIYMANNLFTGQVVFFKTLLEVL